MRQKHCWNYFAFNQSYLAEGKIVPEILLAHDTKNIQKPHFTLVDQDWIWLMIFKNFADRDWTRSEKFHSPLISGKYFTTEYKVG